MKGLEAGQGIPLPNGRRKRQRQDNTAKARSSSFLKQAAPGRKRSAPKPAAKPRRSTAASIPKASQTTCRFEYGTTSAYGKEAPCAKQPGSGTSAVAVSASLKGLTGTTTYHYRVVAENSGKKKGIGADKELKTTEPGTKPTVETQPPSSIVQTTATLNGKVNPGGEPTECEFEYGAVLPSGTKVSCSAAPGSGRSAVAVSAPLTGLTPGTTYRYRLIAKNPLGKEEAAPAEFTTLEKLAPGVEQKAPRASRKSPRRSRAPSTRRGKRSRAAGSSMAPLPPTARKSPAPARRAAGRARSKSQARSAPSRRARSTTTGSSPRARPGRPKAPTPNSRRRPPPVKPAGNQSPAAQGNEGIRTARRLPRRQDDHGQQAGSPHVQAELPHGGHPVRRDHHGQDAHGGRRIGVIPPSRRRQF